MKLLYYLFRSRISHLFYKSTFGAGDRFTNAHSYLKNNPPLTGRLKKYSSTGNLFSKSLNNSFNINTKRTINPTFPLNSNDLNLRIRKKMHKLSNINNKSSSCISPDYFNPLINYKQEEEKNVKNKIKRNYITNKDNLVNMTPTQIYKYTPHIKQSKYNYYLKSQIANLPGSRPSRIGKIAFKKCGKKTFNIKNQGELKEILNGRNRIDPNLKKQAKTYHDSGKNYKIYEFDNPIISSKDINKKFNN